MKHPCANDPPGESARAALAPPEVARSRAWRGIVRHFRRSYRKRRRTYVVQNGKAVPVVTTGPPDGRDAIGPLWHRPGGYGQCLWCELPTEPRRRWHPECANQYTAARGQTRNLYGDLLEPGPCESCGAPGREIDHRLALSIGRALGYRWHVRAHLLSNLRWLCTACHAEKTTEDRRTLRAVQVAKGFQHEVGAIRTAALALPDHVTPRQGRLF